MMKFIKNQISIVIPVYNRTEFLEDAIKSALDQTYDNYELIIIDDGSSNPAIKGMLKKFAAHSRVRIFFDKHQGPGGAINFGAKEVKGEYFCRLDSDDLLTKDALAILNRYINAYPDVSYFYSARYMIDKNNNIMIIPEMIPEWMDEHSRCTSFKFNKERLLREYHCNHLICWRKKDFLAIGGMRIDMYWAEDYELALRMSDYFRFQNIDEALYMVRECSSMRLTDSKSEQEKQEIIFRIQEEARKRRKILEGLSGALKRNIISNKHSQCALDEISQLQE